MLLVGVDPTQRKVLGTIGVIDATIDCVTFMAHSRIKQNSTTIINEIITVKVVV